MADWNEPRLVYRRGRRPKGFVLKSRKPDRSSFQYRSFPQKFHGKAVLSYGVKNTIVQRVLIKILREFNRLELDTSISLADREGYFEGEMSFQVGVANENYFNYLDSYEERIMNEAIAKQGALSIVDFLIVAKYQVRDHERHPVRRDSYLVRFIVADQYSLEVYLSHEKGIRRLNPDELIMMIAKELDRELKASHNASLKIDQLRTS